MNLLPAHSLSLLWDNLCICCMFYYHWLIKKLIWLVARQNRASGKSKQRHREKKGRVRKMPTTIGKARCELTSYKPSGKI